MKDVCLRARSRRTTIVLTLLVFVLMFSFIYINKVNHHQLLANIGKESLVAKLPTRELELEKERIIDNNLPSKKYYTINCSNATNYLIGQIKVNLTVPTDLKAVENFFATANVLSEIRTGGLWKPRDCRSSTKTAIVFPFRKREEQLRVIIRHLHPILQRQLIHYRIFVIEQADNVSFNRGKLFNSAFKEILRLDDFGCFIFHDIDMFVKNDKLLHDCAMSPFHMCSRLDQSNFIPPSLFGGVSALRRAHFQDVNGYSNLYWKWGGEDDDMFWRLKAKGYIVSRPPLEIGTYQMMKKHHFRSDGWNPENAVRVKEVRLQSIALQNKISSDKWIYSEGLSNLTYNLTKIEEYPLYTLLSVTFTKTTK